MTREKLGSFWTDTGTILLGDPCQFVHDHGETPHISYTRLFDLFEEQGRPYTEPGIVVGGEVVVPPFERVERARSVTIPSRGGGVGGIAVNVGCDGFYPVYMERDENGEPVRLIIELGGHVEP
jgi:hypothetical protein